MAQNNTEILVLGATGKTGRRVAALLDERGVPVRRASRSSDTRFDWEDPATWAPALDGVKAAYVVPSEAPVDLDRFMAAVAAGGAERLVLLSARQPDQGGDGVIPAFEAAITAAPTPSVLLRPAWFAQNFTEGMFVDELEQGTLRLPVGDGREPFVDLADVAEIAVDALLDPRHDGAAYDISGPELMTFAEAVAQLGAARGRELSFEPVDFDAWAAGAADFLPAPVITLLGNLFAGIRNGDNAYVSDGVQQALGRAPRPFAAAL